MNQDISEEMSPAQRLLRSPWDFKINHDSLWNVHLSLFGRERGSLLHTIVAPTFAEAVDIALNLAEQIEPTAADVLFPGLSEPSRPIRSGDRITIDGCEIIAKVTTAPIRSGDRIATGTGPARRRLTQAEAEAGGLPEPFTPDEWRAMAQASTRGEWTWKVIKPAFEEAR